MPLALASVFAALLGLTTTALAFNVSLGRIRQRIPHGEGPNRELARPIRAHMNAVEHLVPIALPLVLYALLEGDARTIVVFGVASLLARVALTVGILQKGAFNARRTGAYGTYLIELALAVLVVVQAVAWVRT